MFKNDINRALRKRIFSSIGYILLALLFVSYLLLSVAAFLYFVGYGWVTWIIVAAVIALFIYIETFSLNKYKAKMKKHLSQLSDETIAELERQYRKSEAEFSSFYMFDTHIYAPEQLIFVPYEIISDVKMDYRRHISVRHPLRSFKVANLVINCIDNSVYKINIKDIDDFRECFDTLCTSIYKRRENCLKNNKQEEK